MDLQEDLGCWPKNSEEQSGISPKVYFQSRAPGREGGAHPLRTPGRGGEETPAPALRGCRNNRAPQQSPSLKNVLSICSTCSRAVLNAGRFPPSAWRKFLLLFY